MDKIEPQHVHVYLLVYINFLALKISLSCGILNPSVVGMDFFWNHTHLHSFIHSFISSLSVLCVLKQPSSFEQF